MLVRSFGSPFHASKTKKSTPLIDGPDWRCTSSVGDVLGYPLEFVAGQVEGPFLDLVACITDAYRSLEKAFDILIQLLVSRLGSEQWASEMRLMEAEPRRISLTLLWQNYPRAR